MSMGRDQISFEIKEHIGVIDINDTNWKLEANIVNWNNSPVDKLDLRLWSEDHSRMTRGSTFTKEQAVKLAQILSDRFL